jgi:hypothetical protein
VVLHLSLLLALGHREQRIKENIAVPAENRRRLNGERGDVPGWVMVTLMSALLVAGIYAVAGPALINMFTNAINKVGGLK